jgi:replication-associated recombination protein RarA
MQILKGKQSSPVRAVIYGVEGIGKTSIAAELPDALILDTEDGSKQIDCARALCLDWRSIEHAVKELIKDDQGFKTIVIDSADWMEKALIDHMLRLSGKSSIEDYGYGKGYTYDHDTPEGFSGDNYWPEGMAPEQFYTPVERGFEREVKKRLEYWDKLRAERG